MRVVAAVLEDNVGRVMLAQRPPGKQDAGCWEFPGGKVEPGESAFDALRRELHEELGIEVTAASRFMCVRRRRAFGELALEAWRVSAWQGVPEAHEHSALVWQLPQEARSLSLCDADVPICRVAGLPSSYAITPDPGATIPARFLERIEAGLDRGIRLLQWRAPTLDVGRYRDVASELRTMTARFGARLLLNTSPALAMELGADGVHLNASRVMAMSATQAWPKELLVAASVHGSPELAQAAAIGVDFVVVSPIRRTGSHPQAEPIGWSGLRQLIEHSDVPAYALGGLGPDDVSEARAHGALGVAGISAFW